MKAQKISITALAVALLMFIGSDIYAQRQGGNNRGQNVDREPMERCSNILDLTPEQETKIEALRVDQLKKRTEFRNQMNELRAKKQTLMASDKSDLNAINGIVDQMTSLQNKMMKERAKNHQDIRNLLTDSQKVYFDSRPMRGRGNKSDRGMRDDRGQEYGQGNYRNNR